MHQQGSSLGAMAYQRTRSARFLEHLNLSTCHHNHVQVQNNPCHENHKNQSQLVPLTICTQNAMNAALGMLKCHECCTGHAQPPANAWRLLQRQMISQIQSSITEQTLPTHLRTTHARPKMIANSHQTGKGSFLSHRSSTKTVIKRQPQKNNNTGGHWREFLTTLSLG